MRTNDPGVIKRAVAGCDGVLVVLVPRGVHGYSTGTAQAVLDHAPPGARLIFSCGWHITRDGQDVYSRKLKAIVNVFGPLARLARFADLDDQVEACRRVFASETRWTVVRGSDLEEGESQGLPVWSRHVGDPILESNITRRVDFALFMVEALENDQLVHEAPAIVGCQSPSARTCRQRMNRGVRQCSGMTPNGGFHFTLNRSLPAAEMCSGRPKRPGSAGSMKKVILVDLASAQGEHHHAPGLRAQVAAEGRLAVGAGRAHL